MVNYFLSFVQFCVIPSGVTRVWSKHIKQIVIIFFLIIFVICLFRLFIINFIILVKKILQYIKIILICKLILSFFVGLIMVIMVIIVLLATIKLLHFCCMWWPFSVPNNWIIFFYLFTSSSGFRTFFVRVRIIENHNCVL